MIVELTSDERSVKVSVGDRVINIPGNGVITIRVLPVNEQGDEKTYICYYPKTRKDGSTANIPLEVGVVIRYLGRKDSKTTDIGEEEEDRESDEDEANKKKAVTKYHVTLTRKGKADPDYVISASIMKVADKDYIFEQ